MMWHDADPGRPTYSSKGTPPETLDFDGLPLGHEKHHRGTDIPESPNKEIKHKAQAARMLSNQKSRFRLTRSPAVEAREDLPDANLYLDMQLDIQLLAEHKREQPRQPEETG